MVTHQTSDRLVKSGNGSMKCQNIIPFFLERNFMLLQFLCSLYLYLYDIAIVEWSKEQENCCRLFDVLGRQNLDVVQELFP